MTTPAAADDGGPAPAGVPAGEARGLCTAPSPVFPAATPWLLIAAFVAVATATLRDYGVTWDEGLGDLYFGDVYLETFKSGGDPARLPPTPAKLPEHWGRPGEPDYDKSPLRFLPVHHWPVSNVVAAACGEVFHRRLGLLDPIDARHFGIVLLAALALAATWTFAKEVFGDGAAFAAVVLLGSYPEWFALSHDMVKDVGETAFYGWTLVAFHRAFTRGGELRWALAALALAAALGTKLNAVYAVATVAVWACVWALASALRRRRGIGSGPLVRHLLAGLVVAGVLAASFVGVRGALAAGGVDLVGLAQAGELDATWAFGFVVAIVPAALGIAWFVARRGGVELRRLGAFALATAVGGTLFVASWPWLWPAPAARLVEQLVTFAEVARRDAPDWQAYPWVQALLRTPPTMLAAAALGVIAAPFAVRRGKGAAVVLLLLWLLVPLMRCAAPSFRNYDGIRRFLEFLPALAIFAGAGTALIAAGAARLFVRRGAASGAPEAARRAGRRAAILATAVAAAPAL
ncbi:MAG TPA: glycosyltransferase family 39 protein, partial [Planctomycetota bacterium]|nr:glycosyltransferase family 39 protein [Planctomycetota bacterium]